MASRVSNTQLNPVYGRNWGKSLAKQFKTNILRDGGILHFKLTPLFHDCPISQEKMTNPVFTVDGGLYDNKSITKWFEANRRAGKPPPAPLTGLDLPSQYLMEAAILANAIEGFLSENDEIYQRMMPTYYLCYLNLCRLSRAIWLLSHDVSCFCGIVWHKLLTLFGSISAWYYRLVRHGCKSSLIRLLVACCGLLYVFNFWFHSSTTEPYHPKHPYPYWSKPRECSDKAWSHMPLMNQDLDPDLRFPVDQHATAFYKHGKKLLLSSAQVWGGNAFKQWINCEIAQTLRFCKDLSEMAREHYNVNGSGDALFAPCGWAGNSDYIADSQRNLAHDRLAALHQALNRNIAQIPVLPIQRAKDVLEMSFAVDLRLAIQNKVDFDLLSTLVGMDCVKCGLTSAALWGFGMLLDKSRDDPWSPTFTYLYFYASVRHSDLGRFQEALVMVEYCLKLDEYNAECRYQKAALLDALGKPSKSAWEIAIARFPSFPVGDTDPFDLGFIRHFRWAEADLDRRGSPLGDSSLTPILEGHARTKHDNLKALTS